MWGFQQTYRRFLALLTVRFEYFLQTLIDNKFGNGTKIVTIFCEDCIIFDNFIFVCVFGFLCVFVYSFALYQTHCMIHSVLQEPIILIDGK